MGQVPMLIPTAVIKLHEPHEPDVPLDQPAREKTVRCIGAGFGGMSSP